MNYEFGIKNQHSAFCILHSRHGFTMLELMVAIGIFALITGAVLANFRGGERQEELRLAADNVKSLIEQARTMTLTGQVKTYTTGGNTKTGFPRGGYGITIERAPSFVGDFDRYRFVAFDLAPGGENNELWYVDKIQPIDLPRSIRVGLVAGGDLFTMVTFDPLQGNMSFRGAGGAIVLQQTGRIDITHTALPEQKRSIFLDRVSGRISIE